MSNRPKKIAIAALVVLALWLVGQIVWAFISYHALQSDVKEAVAQVGGRIGLDVPSTDDDLKAQVIKDADGLGIVVRPEQIEITRLQTEGNWAVRMSVHYFVPIGLPGARVQLPFSITSEKL